jgi:hypothetical protein
LIRGQQRKLLQVLEGVGSEVMPGDEIDQLDFLGYRHVDSASRLKSGQRGGLGIFLIRNLIDRIGYFRDDARNRMVLVRGKRGA